MWIWLELILLIFAVGLLAIIGPPISESIYRHWEKKKIKK